MMSWSAAARAALADGREVVVRPVGNSMSPRIRSGAHVRLEPVADPAAVAVDDVVFVRVRGHWVLHRVSAVEGGRLQIANQRGHINGWVGRERVLGVATQIDNPGPPIS